MYRSEERFRADLELHAGPSESVSVEPGFARIVLADGGEISVSTSPTLTDHPTSDDTVRGTRVPLEATAEILAKKLRYRMIQNRQIVPRDLYDIAVSRWKDPEALDAALLTLRREHIQDIDGELGHLGSGWMERHHQPLLAPASQPDADGAAILVRRALGSHIRTRSSRDDHERTPER